jgi:predicted permease
MPVVSLFLDVLGPVVVLVALGVFARWHLGIAPEALATLAYWLLGPAFVFDSLHDAELAADLVARLVVASLAGMAGAMVVAAAVISAWGGPSAQRSATMLTSAYGNVGNAGLAISAFALGDDVLPLASVVMLTINLTGVALGVGLATARTSTPILALGRAVTAPMAIAGVTALVVNLAGAGLPLVAQRPVEMLADAMIPVMLVTLGVHLAITGAIRWSAALTTTAVAKLVAAPAAAVAIGRSVGLDGDPLAVVAIQSSMPPAVFCALIAIEHDFERDQVTSAVVATTMLSLATVPVGLALVT